jgi:hypothetical protein
MPTSGWISNSRNDTTQDTGIGLDLAQNKSSSYGIAQNKLNKLLFALLQPSFVVLFSWVKKTWRNKTTSTPNNCKSYSS